ENEGQRTEQTRYGLHEGARFPSQSQRFYNERFTTTASTLMAPSAARTDAPGQVDAEARRALAWTHTARFLTTASALAELPVTELPEIAFVGRSNAGKSTAINVLTQQKRLAFASKTPGRTQHINLFELGPKLS